MKPWEILTRILPSSHRILSGVCSECLMWHPRSIQYSGTTNAGGPRRATGKEEKEGFSAGSLRLSGIKWSFVRHRELFQPHLSSVIMSLCCSSRWVQAVRIPLVTTSPILHGLISIFHLLTCQSVWGAYNLRRALEMTLVGLNNKNDRTYESALVAHRALINTVTRCINCFPSEGDGTPKTEVGLLLSRGLHHHSWVLLVTLHHHHDIISSSFSSMGIIITSRLTSVIHPCL